MREIDDPESMHPLCHAVEFALSLMSANAGVQVRCWSGSEVTGLEEVANSTSVDGRVVGVEGGDGVCISGGS